MGLTMGVFIFFGLYDWLYVQGCGNWIWTGLGFTTALCISFVMFFQYLLNAGLAMAWVYQIGRKSPCVGLLNIDSMFLQKFELPFVRDLDV